MKPTLIILEGVDGSGKSTLVDLIANQLGFKSKHFGPVKNKEEGIREYVNFITETNQSYVLDRFMGGEFTYSRIYRGYDSYDELEMLEQMLKEKFNVVLVLVKAPLGIIQERLDTRGEDFLQMDHVKDVMDGFVEYYEKSSLNKVVVDTYWCSPGINIQRILKHV